MRRRTLAQLSFFTTAIALLIAVAMFALPGFAQQGYPPNDQGAYPPNNQQGYPPPNNQQGYPPNDQQGYPSNNQAGDPPSRVARLSYLNGKVSFEPSGENQWSQASSNYPMTTGDRLYTDNDGRAELETGNIAVRMASNTDLSTTTLSDRLLQLGLSQGTLHVRAYEIYPGNSVEIDTPGAALTLLRAGSYRVETYPDGNTTLVAVTEGDLEISGNGINQTLHAGQAIKLEGTEDVRMDWISLPDRDDFDQWCGDRDRRFLNSNSRQYVSPYTPGYADLDEYGRWDNAPEYGRVWYPSQVPAGWAPYRYGRWVWVEPWGWTWVEEEPWGFAPFHYGRWALIGARWGWVPGPVVVRVRPIYAPALVAFVGGPNAGIQVWFPLGPRDPYLPWYHHSDEYRRQVNITNVRITNINITNIRAENIHYAYQRIAPTACNTDTFRGSRSVAREQVRVNFDDIGRARVINHPDVRPDERTVHAGRPDAHPPVERTRPYIDNRVVNARPGGPEGGRPGDPRNDRGGPPDRDRNPVITHQGEAGNPGGPVRQPGIRPGDNRGNDSRGNDNRSNDARGNEGRNNNDRNGEANPRGADAGRPPDQPNRNLPGRNNPPPTGDTRGRDNNGRDNITRDNGGRDNRDNNGGPYRPQPAIVQNGNNRGPDNGPPQEHRPLVTKNPAPPQNPSFSQRQPAMQDHPGRPLEPQQVENIRRGQAAGPREDREVPSHANPPAPRQGPPPARNEPKPDREHERDKH